MQEVHQVSTPSGEIKTLTILLLISDTIENDHELEQAVSDSEQ